MPPPCIVGGVGDSKYEGGRLRRGDVFRGCQKNRCVVRLLCQHRWAIGAHSSMAEHLRTKWFVFVYISDNMGVNCKILLFHCEDRIIGVYRNGVRRNACFPPPL